MSHRATLLWVNKTANSSSLSHSDNKEQILVFSQAERTSRILEQKRRKKRLNAQAKLCPLVHTVSSDLTWNPKESRSINFFLDATVHKILSLRRDHVFWTETVPCLAQNCKAIRHLVVAIASTHELLQLPNAGDTDVFALTQCNKATKLLREEQLSPTVLIVSCILVSAFSLLRCDHSRAELSIKSGLKLSTTTPKVSKHSNSGDAEEYRQILERLNSQHGYKLWNSDVIFEFEKSQVTGDALIIESDHVKGPFTEVGQIVKAYRSLMLEVVAKTLRNVARGAFISPYCRVAQDNAQQLSKLLFYWKFLYGSLPKECVDIRTDLEQVRVAIGHAYLVFHTKVISPQELTFDAFPSICFDMLDFADKVLAARRAGHPVIYMDKLVNGVLFGMGLCCLDRTIGRRIVSFLKSQASFDDGLVNWVRGTVIDLIMRNKEQRSNRHERLILTGLSYVREVPAITLEHTIAAASDIRHTVEYPVDWKPWFSDKVMPHEVDDILQGIMTAYRMYGKPHPSKAPRGFVRKMYYQGKPVPVWWDSEALNQFAVEKKT